MGKIGIKRKTIQIIHNFCGQIYKFYFYENNILIK